MGRSRLELTSAEPPPGAVPDVLAPNLRAVFCGINPGRASARAGAHFANPRNDFWRLLRDADLTPRLLRPDEQFAALRFGLGLTNAASRTTRGSADLRRGDFAAALPRLERIARELSPHAIAFVGKEAYRGAFGERSEHGLQERRLGDTLLFVLPSTSPANAAVPYAERLRWFRELRALLEPVERSVVRALVVDAAGRVLLVRLVSPGGVASWAPPGAALAPGDSPEEALRRWLLREVVLRELELGPLVWRREHERVWDRVVRQREAIYLVRVGVHEVAPLVEPAGARRPELRWWRLDELEGCTATLTPRRLPALLRDLLERGPPAEPVDAGV